MIKVGEEDLICDFAETYHILDFRGLPAYLAATLALGLRDDSRIKMKINGAKASVDRILLASAVDKLSFLAWAKTKDAEHGRNRPKSLLQIIMGYNASDNNNVVAFENAEDWEAERNRLIEEAKS